MSFFEKIKKWFNKNKKYVLIGGTVLLTVANQERAKLGLENPQVHDTDKAIHCAIEAIRDLIKQDNL